MFHPGCPFDFRLDPSETLTIRRILTPDRVANKGKAVYRFEWWITPWLEENGWEYVGPHKKDRRLCYYRSPESAVAESFTIHAAIPNDDAILRAAAAMIRFAQRESGPGDPGTFDGRLGRYRLEFYM